MRAIPASQAHPFLPHPPWPLSFFFFNDTPTTEISTLPLHDALPIPRRRARRPPLRLDQRRGAPDAQSRRGSHDLRQGTHRAVRFQAAESRTDARHVSDAVRRDLRSEEHTSELQSQSNLVCRLLLEKK